VACILVLPPEPDSRACAKSPPVTPKIRHVILCKDYTFARPVSRRVVNYDEKEIGYMSSEQKDFLSIMPPARVNVWDTGTRAEQNQTLAGAAGFIDQKQLLARLPISRRTLFNWRTTGIIPCVRLGGRRILFHWPSVEAALLRHQQPLD
jgi:hypothetical protein